MKTMHKFLLALSLTVLVACAGLKFSQQSLDDTKRIMDQVTSLLQQSNEKYTGHAAEVDKVKQEVLAVYAKEQARKGNDATIAMWGEVINAKGSLFDFFDKWKANNTISRAMREQSVIQIQRLLNSIYDLENHKKR
jgi:hypothetical protein